MNRVPQGNAENVVLANKVEEEERAGAGEQEPVASLSPRDLLLLLSLVPENCHPMKEELLPFTREEMKAYNVSYPAHIHERNLG